MYLDSTGHGVLNLPRAQAPHREKDQTAEKQTGKDREMECKFDAPLDLGVDRSVSDSPKLKTLFKTCPGS